MARWQYKAVSQPVGSIPRVEPINMSMWEPHMDAVPRRKVLPTALMVAAMFFTPIVVQPPASAKIEPQLTVPVRQLTTAHPAYQNFSSLELGRVSSRLEITVPGGVPLSAARSPVGGSVEPVLVPAVVVETPQAAFLSQLPVPQPLPHRTPASTVVDPPFVVPAPSVAPPMDSWTPQMALMLDAPRLNVAAVTISVVPSFTDLIEAEEQPRTLVFLDEEEERRRRKRKKAADLAALERLAEAQPPAIPEQEIAAETAIPALAETVLDAAVPSAQSVAELAAALNVSSRSIVQRVINSREEQEREDEEILMLMGFFD